MTKEIHYTVRGFWPFPVDMLRHDGSRAASQSDQDMIDRLSADHAPDRAAFNPVEINLIGPNRPHTARWESFSGWSVPSDTEHAALKESVAKRRSDQVLFDSAMKKLTADERRVVEARLF